LKRSEEKTWSNAPERHLGVGDGGLALERGLGGAERVQALVDLGVDAADEERRHRVDALARSMPVLRGLLQAGEVGVHDRAVAVLGEDQRHVDRDARGDRGR
jgi:hypothetical protein